MPSNVSTDSSRRRPRCLQAVSVSRIVVVLVVSYLGLNVTTRNSTIGVEGERIGDERRELLERSLSLHQAGDLDKAAELYRFLLEVNPLDPDALHLLGLVYHSKGKEASESYSAEAKNSNSGNSIELFRKAENLVRAAVSSASNARDVALMMGNLGEVLRASGDLEGSVTVLRQIVTQEGIDDEVQQRAKFNLAVTLINLRNLIAGNKSGIPSMNFSEGTSTNNGSSPLCYSEREGGCSFPQNSVAGVADKEEVQQDLQGEAEDLLRGVVSAHPEYKAAMVELAMLLKDKAERSKGGGSLTTAQDNLMQEALQGFQHAAELDAKDSFVALEVAVAQHQLGHRDKAREGYLKVLTMESQQEPEDTGSSSDEKHLNSSEWSVLRAGTLGSAHTLHAMTNLAALKQEVGNVEGAVEWYRQILSWSPKNVVVQNNLGAALMSLGEHTEGLGYLEKALSMDPDNIDVMVNLGVHWQEEGDLPRARDYYIRSLALRRNDGLLVRMAIALSPVVESKQAMLQELKVMESRVDELGSEMRSKPLVLADPCRGVERVHFYLVYRGGNSRPLQEKIVRMYIKASPGLLAMAPHLIRPPMNTNVTTCTSIDKLAVKSLHQGEEVLDSESKLRVGFISKFFGEQEPHGMLLEGVIRLLPRPFFYVVVCPIVSPGKRLSTSLEKGADSVVEVPSHLSLARSTLMGLRLDVIVYADMNGEPISHFLGFARMAKVQAVFWGNPITTGNPSIDYFVSADILEGPNLTTLTEDEERYSEQVVLLGGQGIWYDAPTLPASLRHPIQLPPDHWPQDSDRLLSVEYAWRETKGAGKGRQQREISRALLRRKLKSKLGLGEESVVYMCPQSLFKLHPDFDIILRQVLEAFQPEITISRHGELDKNASIDVSAHLVLTEGRRRSWTRALRTRLKRSCPDIMERVHFLPRTSSGEEFYTLLASADILLHPFPFGGSRTAADGLAVGVPVVVMEGDALPGRMAYSLYNTMGMATAGPEGCCVARSSESYVDLAVRLGKELDFRRKAVKLIDLRSPAIWGQLSVVQEWSRFLGRVGELSPESLEEANLAIGVQGSLPVSGLIEAGLQGNQSVHEENISAVSREDSRLMQQEEGIEGSSSTGSHRHTGTSKPCLEMLESEGLSALLEEFRALHKDGNLSKAAQVLEKVLGIMEGALSAGDAKDGSERVCRDSSDDMAIAAVLNDLGCTLQQLWRLEEAEAVLKRAIGLRPGYTSAMTNLGVTLQGMGKLAEAGGWHLRALTQTPEESRDLCLFNLAMLMKGQSRLLEATELLEREMALPPIDSGGKEVISLSSVTIQPYHRQILLRLQAQKGMQFSLWDEVQRLQSSYPISSNCLVVLLGLMGKLGGVTEMLKGITGMEALFTRSDEATLLPPELHTQYTQMHSPSQGQTVTPTHGLINVVIQYYRPKDKRRAYELDLCLQRNLMNPYVGKVHIALEGCLECEEATGRRNQSFQGKGKLSRDEDTLFPVLSQLDSVYADKAVVVRDLDHRMTFQDALSYSNRELNGEIVILANADIFFDESLARLGDPTMLDMENKVFALAKWESSVNDLGHEDSLTLVPRIDSQDAWVLRSPVPIAVLEGADFEFGRPRCDGRIASLFTEAGYEVTNPSLSLILHHVHSSSREKESIYRGENQVPGDTVYVRISDKWLF